MGPVFLGDEVQVGSGGWLEYGLDGFSPRIADGTGGQASPSVSVIRSVGLKVDSGKVTVEILEAINYSGIALKSNPLPQPIQKHTSNQWPFLRHSSFPFHH